MIVRIAARNAGVPTSAKIAVTADRKKEEWAKTSVTASRKKSVTVSVADEVTTTMTRIEGDPTACSLCPSRLLD
jgi:hypothetical protein